MDTLPIHDLSEKCEQKFRLIRTLVGPSENIFLNYELAELSTMLQDLSKLIRTYYVK